MGDGDRDGDIGLGLGTETRVGTALLGKKGTVGELVGDTGGGVHNHSRQCPGEMGTGTGMGVPPISMGM